MTSLSPSWSHTTGARQVRRERIGELLAGRLLVEGWNPGRRRREEGQRHPKLVDRPHAGQHPSRMRLRPAPDATRPIGTHQSHRHRLRRTLRTFSHSTSHSRRRHATHPPRGPFYSWMQERRRRHRRGPRLRRASLLSSARRHDRRRFLRMGSPRRATLQSYCRPPFRQTIRLPNPANRASLRRVQRTFGRRESSRRSRRRPPPKRCSNRLRARALLLSRASGMKSPS